MPPDPVSAQSEAAVLAVRSGLQAAEVIGAYLYGSAVAGGLRPDSDLDIFVVTDRRLTHAEKRGIVTKLIPISGRATRPAEWRPLEVTIVARPDVRPWRPTPRMELQYGEWLRDQMLAGHVEPDPAGNPDLAVLVTMVRERSRALLGPPATDILDPVPAADLARCMLDGVPSLMADLADDTRNVLLTLARIWVTLETGAIRSKDEAAEWAVSRLPDAHRPMLRRARDLYRAGGFGDPWEEEEARMLADHLVTEIERGSRRAG